MPPPLWDDPEPLAIIGGNSRISFDGSPPEVVDVQIQRDAFLFMLRLFKQRAMNGLQTRLWVCIDHNTPSPRRSLLRPGTTTRQRLRPTLADLRDELRSPLSIPAEHGEVQASDIRVMFEAHLRSSIRNRLQELPEQGALHRQVFSIDEDTGKQSVRCRAIFAEAMRRALDEHSEPEASRFGVNNLLMCLEPAPWTLAGNINAAGVLIRELGWAHGRVGACYV